MCLNPNEWERLLTLDIDYTRYGKQCCQVSLTSLPTGGACWLNKLNPLLCNVVFVETLERCVNHKVLIHVYQFQ